MCQARAGRLRDGGYPLCRGRPPARLVIRCSSPPGARARCFSSSRVRGNVSCAEAGSCLLDDRSVEHLVCRVLGYEVMKRFYDDGDGCLM